MSLKSKTQKLEGLLAATLLMVLASISTEATSNTPEDKTIGWVANQTFGTKSHDSEHQCGQSPLRNETGNASAIVGGAGGAWVGAGIGAKVGSACDVAFAGTTLGLCTIAGAAIGAFGALFFTREIGDKVDGYSDCAGGIIRGIMTGQRRWGVSRPIPGVCMTCTATCGSGYRIVGIAIITERRATAAPG